MSQITVVIATFNRQAMLRELLDNLRSQVVDPDVIVMDDSQYAGYHRVARYNEGVSKVTTPYLILLDDDCLPMNVHFTESYIELLSEVDVVRGLFGTLEKPEITPWFSAANLGIRTPLAKELGPFDMAYDGKYGFEDLDLEHTFNKIKARVSIGTRDTGVVHRGVPNHAYHTGLEENKRYYCKKWSIPYE